MRLLLVITILIILAWIAIGVFVIVIKVSERADEIKEEIDRNARAYGFEIGRGRPLTRNIARTSPDNPFLDKNWRDKIQGD